MKPKTLADRRDALLLLASHVYYKLTGVAVLAILGRTIDDAHLGVYFFAIGVVGPLLLIAHGGTNPLIARRVAARGPDAFKPFILLRAGLAIAYLAALALAAFATGPIWRVVLAVGLVELVRVSHSALGSLFIAAGRVRYNVVIGVIAQTAWVVALVLLLEAGPRLESVVGADAIRAGLLGLAAAAFAHFRVVRFEGKWDRTIVYEALPFFVLAAGASAFAHLTTIAIGAFTRYEEVARFGLALRVAMGTTFIAATVGAVVARVLSRQGVTRETSRLFAARSLALNSGGILLAVLLALAPSALCAALFGEAHRDVGRVLVFMVALVPLWQWTTFSSMSLQAVHKERIVIVAACAGGFVTLAAIPIVVPSMGAIGGAIAVTCGTLVQAAILGYGTSRVGLVRMGAEDQG